MQLNNLSRRVKSLFLVIICYQFCYHCYHHLTSVIICFQLLPRHFSLNSEYSNKIFTNLCGTIFLNIFVCTYDGISLHNVISADRYISLISKIKPFNWSLHKIFGRYSIYLVLQVLFIHFDFCREIK